MTIILPPLPSLPTVTISIDGQSRPNPGPGTWAAIFTDAAATQKKISGSYPHTSNNRMEHTAAYMSLKELSAPHRVIIVTACEYVTRCAENGLPLWLVNDWRTTKGQPVSNQDLWRLIIAAGSDHEIKWKWVPRMRGGSSHFYERATNSPDGQATSQP